MLDGQVELIEALGSDLLVHFRIDATRVEAEGVHDDDAAVLFAGELGCAARASLASTPGRVKAGERLRVTVDLQQIQLFDPATGGAISE